MLSAFGVEHGVSKSFRKLQPKLLRVEQGYDRKTNAHDTMSNKLRRHAVNVRLDSGGIGAGYRQGLKRTNTPKAAQPFFDRVFRESSLANSPHIHQEKRAAHDMYAAISRLNRRQRFLP